MKRIILTIFAVFLLSACGGGGGGAAPSMNSDDSRVDDVRMDIDTLRSEVTALGNVAGTDELLEKIKGLVEDIDTARRTIDELLTAIEGLRTELEKIKVADPNPPTNLPIAQCTDFRVRDTNGDCTYDTPEYRGGGRITLINALYAYEQGYHGQGVTVVNAERVLAAHDDLRENVLTMDIGVDCQGLSASSNLKEYISRYGCDRFAENEVQALIDIRGIAIEDIDFRYFHGTATGGLIVAARNGITMHGVAPRAKLIPISNTGAFRTNDRTADLQYIIDNEIPIVSHSTYFTGDQAMFLRHYAMFEGVDTVLVWANGNSGSSHMTVRLNQSTIPAHNQALERNWINAAGYNSNRTTVRLTRCGETKMWCISAPGTGARTPAGPNTDDYYRGTYNNGFGGSSAAAPIVAGALAVLKSAAPHLSITVIRQILLASADDLGDEGIDEVFGWGGVNISAGIVSIMAMKTQSGVLVSDLRESLPGEFAHLRGHLSDVSVALRITDRSYYNMRLSDIVGGGYDSAAAEIGGAAKEMQTDAYKAGESFRFWGGLDYDGGKSNYIGEGGGIFSAANTEDIGGYMRWTTANYGGISAFGEYGRTAIKADYGGNPLIAAVDNARAEEWTMGIQYRDLWRKDDNIILSARQESRISGGNMILRYPVADGDSHKAFIGETPQTIRTETTKIPIKQKPQTIWTLGYSQQTDNGKWSAAAEYNAATNDKALSFAIELQIR